MASSQPHDEDARSSAWDGALFVLRRRPRRRRPHHVDATRFGEKPVAYVEISLDDPQEKWDALYARIEAL